MQLKMLFLAAIFRIKACKNRMGLNKFKISRLNNQNIQVSSGKIFLTWQKMKKFILKTGILQAEVSQS